MQEKKFKELLKKYLDGAISSNEEKLLEEFDDKLIDKNKGVIFESEFHKKQLGQEIKGKLFKKPSRNFNWLKIAASILLFMGAVYGYLSVDDKPERKDPVATLVKSTERGSKLNVTLPDGTKVRLNSNSSIIYPEKFEGTTREVTFTGEAFFEVAENAQKPFIVRTNKMSTTVLGTSFNVNAYPENNKIAVTVATGKVKLSTESEEEILLIPNQQGIFDMDAEHFSKRKIDITTFLEWKDGIIRFKDTPLSETSKKLSRWFNVDIKFENKATQLCKFTGKFNNENLQTILEGLVFVKSGLSFEFVDNKTILIKGKCTN